MAAPASTPQAGLGWTGRTLAVLAALTATAVTTTAPAYAPAAVLERTDAFDGASSAAQGGTDALYVVVVPAATADLAVSDTGPATVAVGTLVAYHLAVTNLAAAVGEATLTDHLPAGFEVRHVDAPGCAVGNRRTLTCTLTVTGLAVETVTVSGTFATGGVVDNRATVFSAGDPDPGNDSSTTRTRVTP